ncbi:MAG: hypothetical protein ACLQUY_24825 [Ktedonobacterales bacterium]
METRASVHVLVKAGLAEYYEWGTTRWQQRVGTAARLVSPPAKEVA